MAEETNIEWCDRTWSPWLGCRKKSEECNFCYIEDTPALRFRGLKLGMMPERTSEAYWRKPLAWNRKAGVSLGWSNMEGPLPIERPRVFPSLCDWLDERVPIKWLADFLNLIRLTPHMDWLLLTKRPENWAKRIFDARNFLTSGGDADTALMLHDWLPKAEMPGMPAQSGKAPANVWFGVSAGNQKRLEERAPQLLGIPAAVHFVSCEPLLGAIDLTECRFKDEDAEIRLNSLSGETWVENSVSPSAYCDDNKGIDWVIVGGESGKGARACEVEWIRSIVAQCKASGVACFVKQLGARPVSDGSDLADVSDRKGGDPAEWEQGLRVREWPKTAEG